MCSSTLSLTSALDGVGCLTPRPGHSNTGKETQYTLYRRLGGPKGRFSRGRKISQWWNDTDREKLKYWEKNIIQRVW
jgi:hypothetical protein